MTNPRPAPIATASLLRLLALGVIWGMSFIFLRMAAPVFGPLPTTAGRICCGALLLGLLVAFGGIGVQLRARLRFHLEVGFFNTALPFFLFSWAAVRTPSAYLATINALAPLFAAGFGRALTGEQFSAQRLAGFLVGLTGVAVLVGLGPAPVTPELLWGVAAGLGAAACYGFAAVHVRRFGDGLPPLAVATGSLLAAAGMILIPLLAMASGLVPLLGPLPHPPSPLPWTPVVAVLLLGALCTGLAYAVYFRLVADEGVGRAVTVTFLVPMFATVWGIVLLGEHVTLMALAGILLVLGGTALSLGLLPTGRLFDDRLRRVQP